MNNSKPSPNRFSDLKKLKYFAFVLALPYLFIAILLFYYAVSGELNEIIKGVYNVFR